MVAETHDIVSDKAEIAVVRPNPCGDILVSDFFAFSFLEVYHESSGWISCRAGFGRSTKCGTGYHS